MTKQPKQLGSCKVQVPKPTDIATTMYLDLHDMNTYIFVNSNSNNRILELG